MKSRANGSSVTRMASFPGFPKECATFWVELARHNDKTWFQRNRTAYERFVLGPSRRFVAAMGERLQTISPRISAVPAVNGSLFRIHRDTRFSPDKRPFKTHMGIYFWEGDGKRWECSGYYFHLEPPELMLAVGIYVFPKDLLTAYRSAVVNDKRGRQLARIIRRVTASAGYSVGGEHYKRVPRGYDPEHQRANLLRYKGLHAVSRAEIPEELHTPAILDYCFEKWRDMSPLHAWLVKLTQTAAT
jgi:uncharacterized protein (TIGR02453 family)